MEFLREIVVLIHIIGFAVLFGSWAVQAFGGQRRFTGLMNVGLVIAALAGLALAAPWGITWEPGASFYIKIGVKLVILVIIGGLIGAGMAIQKRTEKPSPGLFWGVGVLTLVNAGIGVLWH